MLMSQRAKRFLKFGVGIAIMATLLYIAGTRTTLNAFLRADFSLLLLGALITPVNVFLHVLRWHRLVGLFTKEASTKLATKMTLVGFFFGSITPSKIGEITKYHYLAKHHNLPKGTAISLTLIDRLFDLVLVAIIGLMGLLLFVLQVGAVNAYPLLLVGGLMVGLFLLAFNDRVFIFGIGLLVKSASKLRARFGSGSLAIADVVKQIHRPLKRLKSQLDLFALLGFLSLLIWVLIGVQMSLFLAAFGSPVQFGVVFVFVCVGALASLAPITVSGLGTRDAMLVYLFSLLSVPAESVILSTILIFMVGILAPAIVGGLIYTFGSYSVNPKAGTIK